MRGICGKGREAGQFSNAFSRSRGDANQQETKPIEDDTDAGEKGTHQSHDDAVGITVVKSINAAKASVQASNVAIEKLRERYENLVEATVSGGSKLPSPHTMKWRTSPRSEL